MHCILDSRMKGSVLNNLKMFTAICGKEAMPNIVLATTKWGEVIMAAGERREVELKEDFWKGMIADGCRAERFKDTYESAWFIIDCISAEGLATVQLSQEMVERRLKLKHTQAGITLNNELKRLIKARKEASRRIRAQAKKQDNALVVQELNKQRVEIDKKITETADELQKLKIPLASHVSIFIKGLLFRN